MTPLYLIHGGGHSYVTRNRQLERILTWMHHSGAASYDPAAHAADDPAAILLAW